jgi:hypothetical protein
MRSFIIISLSLVALACAPASNTTSPSTEEAEQPPVGYPTGSASTTGDHRRSEADTPFVTGQTLYAPVYSHVYFGHEKRHFNLACTLSIRNVDTRWPITLTTVDYHNTEGDLVRSFLDSSRTLAPLATVDYYIQERDTSGGSGANFIIRWGSATAVDPPIVEAVMIGVADGQGISFVSPSCVISE